MLPLPCMSLPVTLKSSVSIRWLKLQAYVLFNSCVNTSWCIRAIFAKTLELERFQTAKVTFKVIAIWCHSIDKGKEYHAPWGVLVRPRSWSSRTHRSTWCFVDRLHRLVDDFTTRLDLDDFRSTWSTCGHVDHSFLLVLAYCIATDTKNSVCKHLMPSQFQVEGLLA